MSALESDVRELVTELGLSQYLDRLAGSGLGNFTALSAASLDDLRKGLGMLPGHARLLHKRLAARGQAAAARSTPAPAPALAAEASPAPVPQVPAPLPSMRDMPTAGLMSVMPMPVMGMVPQPPPPPPQAPPGGGRAVQSVVGEALTFMKTIMGEKDLASPSTAEVPPAFAFDLDELKRRVQAAQREERPAVSATPPPPPAMAPGAEATTPPGPPAAAFSAVERRRRRSRSGSRERAKRPRLTLGRLLREIAASAAGMPATPAAPSDVVPIEQRFVEHLLGPQGHTLRQIAEQSGVRIEVDQGTRGQGYSVVRISDAGSDANLLARELIEAKIRECQ